jgi:predicted lactoylglutathione lyase
MSTKIFVNLPVKDLGASIDFFTKLGFSFHPDYTNDQAGSLVISDDIYAMLVTEEFFATFTGRPVADATKVTEVAVALLFDSRERVDQVVDDAVAQGAEAGVEHVDDEYMYSRGFHDLDGHLWNVLTMKAGAGL